MLFLHRTLVLLAEEGGDGGGGSQWDWMWPLLAMIFILYYFVVIRGGKREKTRREDLLNSLKKNDRVVTIGGIIGTVASTSQDGREVTLKIDDNARIKVLKSAIQGPLAEPGETDGDKSKPDAK